MTKAENLKNISIRLAFQVCNVELKQSILQKRLLSALRPIFPAFPLTNHLLVIPEKVFKCKDQSCS